VQALFGREQPLATGICGVSIEGDLHRFFVMRRHCATLFFKRCGLAGSKRQSRGQSRAHLCELN
jgi:hypothetical protein